MVQKKKKNHPYSNSRVSVSYSTKRVVTLPNMDHDCCLEVGYTILVINILM